MIRKIDLSDDLLADLEAEAKRMKCSLSGVINMRLSGQYTPPFRPALSPDPARIEPRSGPDPAPEEGGLGGDGLRVGEEEPGSTDFRKAESLGGGKRPRKARDSSPPKGFAEFWAAFPRKQKQGDARKAWLQVEHLLPPLAELLAAVERAKASPGWRKEGGQFIPLPATWLRSESWTDELFKPAPFAGSPPPTPGLVRRPCLGAYRAHIRPVFFTAYRAGRFPEGVGDRLLETIDKATDTVQLDAARDEFMQLFPGEDPLAL